MGFPPSSLSFPPVVAPQAAPLPPPSSDCSTPSSSTSGTSPLNSPTGQNSVQHIQSQFIKEGLKMKVRQKLKSEPEEGAAAFEPDLGIKREFEDLTPEDEDRRRRRRERNKVAATKCRNKKKEKRQSLWQRVRLWKCRMPA